MGPVYFCVVIFYHRMIASMRGFSCAHLCLCTTFVIEFGRKTVLHYIFRCIKCANSFSHKTEKLFRITLRQSRMFLCPTRLFPFTYSLYALDNKEIRDLRPSKKRFLKTIQIQINFRSVDHWKICQNFIRLPSAPGLIVVCHFESISVPENIFSNVHRWADNFILSRFNCIINYTWTPFIRSHCCLCESSWCMCFGMCPCVSVCVCVLNCIKAIETMRCKPI